MEKARRQNHFAGCWDVRDRIKTAFYFLLESGLNLTGTVIGRTDIYRREGKNSSGHIFLFKLEYFILAKAFNCDANT